MTNPDTPEAVEQHLNLDTNHEAGLIPMATQTLLRALAAENAKLKEVITEANNSLYGSQGFFLSLDGGEPDKHHLSRGIEKIKESARKKATTAPVAVVRDLVWEDDFIASPFPYQIWADNGGSGAPDDPFEKFNNFRVFEPFLMHPIGPKGDGSDEFETLEEAKAAAQQDYTRRILSALNLRSEQEVRETAVKRASDWFYNNIESGWPVHFVTLERAIRAGGENQ